MTALSTFEWTDLAPPRPITEAVRAGVDRVEMDEFRRTIDLGGKRFLDRIYTSDEIAFCDGRIDRLATRFAAKEAMAKVLGTGFRDLGWSEVEVSSAPNGEPHLVLTGRASNRAELLGISSLALSLSHTTTTAEAFVVALCTNPAAETSQHKETHHG